MGAIIISIKQKNAARRDRCKQIKTTEYIAGDGLSFTARSLPTIVKDEPVEPEKRR